MGRTSGPGWLRADKSRRKRNRRASGPRARPRITSGARFRPGRAADGRIGPSRPAMRGDGRRSLRPRPLSPVRSVPPAPPRPLRAVRSALSVLPGPPLRSAPPAQPRPLRPVRSTPSAPSLPFGSDHADRSMRNRAIRPCPLGGRGPGRVRSTPCPPEAQPVALPGTPCPARPASHRARRVDPVRSARSPSPPGARPETVAPGAPVPCRAGARVGPGGREGARLRPLRTRNGAGRRAPRPRFIPPAAAAARRRQCAISTGTEGPSSTVRLTPEKIASRSREWP